MIAKLRAYWKNYAWQSFCATLTIFIILAVLSLQNAVVVASIGATAFIVFMKPRNAFAVPRNVIGGHLIGLISGSVLALIPHRSLLFAMILYALAVGCSLFAMAVTDTEHPPAAGTALSVAISGFQWETVAAVLTSVVLLALIQRLLRPYLLPGIRPPRMRSPGRCRARPRCYCSVLTRFVVAG
jgi:CBS-domain-containing membrane protein